MWMMREKTAGLKNMLGAALLGAALCLGIFVKPTLSQEPRILRIGTHLPAITLNPWQVKLAGSRPLVVNLFEGLITTGPDGEPIGGLAERWEVSREGTRYRFWIRPNAKWSDGVPITAVSLRDSYRVYYSLPDISRSVASDVILNSVEVAKGEMPAEMLGVSVEEENILVIDLERPAPYFLNVLRDVNHFPLPLHALDAKELAEEWPIDKDVPFSGPFMLVRSSAQSVQAVLNPHYYAREALAIEGFSFRWFNEHNETLFSEIYNGQIDLAYVDHSTQANFIFERLSNFVHYIPHPETHWYVFNLDKPPFDRREIREAMSMALDFESLGASIWENRSIFTTKNLLPDVIAGDFDEPLAEWSSWTAERRHTYAKRIMEEAGYSSKTPLELKILTTSSPIHRRIAEMVVSMWAQIHVRAEIVEHSTNVHYALLDDGEFEVGRAGWGADLNHSSEFLAVLGTGHRSNYGRWSDDQYDQLLNEYDFAKSDQEREEIMKQALEIMHREAIIMPIFSRRALYLIHPNLRGAEANYTGNYYFRWMRIEE